MKGILFFFVLLTAYSLEGVFRASNIRRLQESDLNSPSSVMNGTNNSFAGLPTSLQPSINPPSMATSQPQQLHFQQSQHNLPSPSPSMLAQIPQQQLQQTLNQQVNSLMSPQPTPSISTPQVQPNLSHLYTSNVQNYPKPGNRLASMSSATAPSTPIMPAGQLQSQSFAQPTHNMMTPQTPNAPYTPNSIYPTHQNPVAAGISSLAGAAQVYNSNTPGHFINRQAMNPNGVCNEAFAMLHTMVNQNSKRADRGCSLSGPDWPMSGSSVWTLALHELVYDHANFIKLISPFKLISLAYHL